MPKTKSLATADMTAAQQIFSDWRATREKRCRIPDGLWKVASDLTAHYPISTVCKNLCLSVVDLRKQMVGITPPPSLRPPNPASFIELKLNNPQPSSLLSRSPGNAIELTRPDGTVMKIAISENTPLDILSLCKTFLGDRA